MRGREMFLTPAKNLINFSAVNCVCVCVLLLQLMKNPYLKHDRCYFPEYFDGQKAWAGNYEE